MIEQKSIQLKLYWIPSHLDERAPKTNMSFPYYFFALNYFADHYAGLAAKSVQVEMNCASGVLYHASLVGKKIS